MATIAQSYVLTGQKEFFFPHPVRFSAHIRLDIDGGGLVDPADYEVIGAGPAARRVTIRWPNAPSDSEILTISRLVPIARVTDFTDDQAITARQLNAEFDNIYQILEQMA